MDFNNKPLFLGPMAGNGDYAFRRICKEMGAEYTVTEMVSAKAVWYHDQKTAQIAHIHEDERPCLLQLFGSEEKCFDYAVKTLEESVHPEGFDINIGADSTLGIIDAFHKVFSNTLSFIPSARVEALPNISCGLLCLVLLGIFFTSKKIKKGEKIFC